MKVRHIQCLMPFYLCLLLVVGETSKRHQTSLFLLRGSNRLVCSSPFPLTQRYIFYNGQLCRMIHSTREHICRRCRFRILSVSSLSPADRSGLRSFAAPVKRSQLGITVCAAQRHAERLEHLQIHEPLFNKVFGTFQKRQANNSVTLRQRSKRRSMDWAECQHHLIIKDFWSVGVDISRSCKISRGRLPS